MSEDITTPSFPLPVNPVVYPITTPAAPCTPCEAGSTESIVDSVNALAPLVTETKNEVSKLIPADIDWTPRFFKSAKNVEIAPDNIVVEAVAPVIQDYTGVDYTGVGYLALPESSTVLTFDVYITPENWEIFGNTTVVLKDGDTTLGNIVFDHITSDITSTTIVGATFTGKTITLLTPPTNWLIGSGSNGRVALGVNGFNYVATKPANASDFKFTKFTLSGATGQVFYVGSTWVEAVWNQWRLDGYETIFVANDLAGTGQFNLSRVAPYDPDVYTTVATVEIVDGKFTTVSLGSDSVFIVNNGTALLLAPSPYPLYTTVVDATLTDATLSYENPEQFIFDGTAWATANSVWNTDGVHYSITPTGTVYNRSKWYANDDELFALLNTLQSRQSFTATFSQGRVEVDKLESHGSAQLSALTGLNSVEAVVVQLYADTNATSIEILQADTVGGTQTVALTHTVVPGNAPQVIDVSSLDGSKYYFIRCLANGFDTSMAVGTIYLNGVLEWLPLDTPIVDGVYKIKNDDGTIEDLWTTADFTHYYLDSRIPACYFPYDPADDEVIVGELPTPTAVGQKLISYVVICATESTGGAYVGDTPVSATTFFKGASFIVSKRTFDRVDAEIKGRQNADTVNTNGAIQIASVQHAVLTIAAGAGYTPLPNVPGKGYVIIAPWNASSVLRITRNGGTTFCYLFDGVPYTEPILVNANELSLRRDDAGAAVAVTMTIVTFA